MPNLAAIVSCRKNGWSNFFLSKRNLVHADDPFLLNRIRDAKVLILVHGFNNDKKDVLRAYNLVASHLKPHYDYVLGFTWPGGKSVLSYAGARWRVKEASEALAELIDMMKLHGCTVDLNSHSLGCRVALEATARAKSAYAVRYHQIMAPALPNDFLYEATLGLGAFIETDSIGVFWSRHDGVLRFMYRLGEPLAFGGFKPAMGYKGPSSSIRWAGNPKLKSHDCTPFVSSHGGYKSSDPVYRLIERRIRHFEHRPVTM